MAERVYQLKKMHGHSDNEAKKEAKQTAEWLKTMPDDQVKEFFGKYDILGDVPKDFPEKILDLSNRVDVQLKIGNSDSHTILKALGIDSKGSVKNKEIQDEYYDVKSQSQDNIYLKIRTSTEIMSGKEQTVKTVIIKRTIERNTSERTTQKYEIKCPIGANIQDIIQKVKEELSLDIELTSKTPSGTIKIRRLEYEMFFDDTPVVFNDDTYEDERTGEKGAEIEIKCPENPRLVSGKIKKQLKDKGFQFITTAKKDLLKTDKGLDENPGISPEQ